MVVYILIKETLFSDFSDCDSSLSLSNETCQRTGDLKVDNKCPFVSQPMIKNESTSTEFGQTTLIDKILILELCFS